MTVAAICLLLAIVSAAAVRGMIAVGALDHPGHRSSHSEPTPKGGGAGIVLAVLLGIAILPPGPAGVARADVALAMAAAFLAAVAYADDLRSWPFLPKLGAQIAAAAFVLSFGLAPDTLALPSGPAHLGVWGIPLAFAWLLFVTNAVNFMDGLNGLVSGCAGIAALFLAADTEGFARAAALALAAGIAGFLPFNFPRARIFMGDIGSQFLGFLLAGVALAPAVQAHATPLLMPLLLAPLLLDASFTLVRRAIAGDKLTEAHRGHLYQLAHRAGFPAPAITFMYWGMTAWCGVCALAAAQAGAVWRWPILLATIIPFPVWAAAILGRARRHVTGRW